MGWAVGAVINVIGSIMINLGTNVIKLGHNKTAAASPLEPPPFLRHPHQWIKFPGKSWFLLGLAVFGVGNVLNFASFAFAAQSLLAALGNIQFLTNMLFARFINKELISRQTMFAMGLVVAGAVLMVSFGNHESPISTGHELLHFYSTAPYIFYLSVCFGVVVPAAYYIYRRGKKQIGGLKKQRAIPRPWNRWLPVTYALFSGLLGTQSVLYGKTLSMLLRTSYNGDSQFGFWYFWLSLVLFIFFAAFWMTRYSKALRLFPVSLIMPILQIVWVLFSIVSGSLYYQEYKTLTALSGSMFGVGILVMLAGIVLLTSGQRSGQPEEGLHEMEMEQHLVNGGSNSLQAKDSHDSSKDGVPASLEPSVTLAPSPLPQRGPASKSSPGKATPPGRKPARLSLSPSKGKGKHGRKDSDDFAMPLFAAHPSSAPAAEPSLALLPSPKQASLQQRAPASPPANSGGRLPPKAQAGAATAKGELSLPSRGALARTSEALEEHELNASLTQFARGFAGLDSHLTPLSPAFTAFCVPLVPAVGSPPRRVLSLSSLAAHSTGAAPADDGSTSAHAVGIGAAAAGPDRMASPGGRHRPQRSHSAGELSMILVAAGGSEHHHGHDSEHMKEGADTGLPVIQVPERQQLTHTSLSEGWFNVQVM